MRCMSDSVKAAAPAPTHAANMRAATIHREEALIARIHGQVVREHMVDWDAPELPSTGEVERMRAELAQDAHIAASIHGEKALQPSIRELREGVASLRLATARTGSVHGSSYRSYGWGYPGYGVYRSPYSVDRQIDANEAITDGFSHLQAFEDDMKSIGQMDQPSFLLA